MKLNLKLIALLFIVAFISATSCKKGVGISTKSDTTQLISDLESSATFNKYMMFNSRLQRALLSDQFNLTPATLQNLKGMIAEKKQQSYTSLIEAVGAAGVSDPKQFLFLHINVNHFYHALIAEFPDLKNMSGKEKVRLFKTAYGANPSHKIDYKALLAQRKVNQAKRSPIQ